MSSCLTQIRDVEFVDAPLPINKSTIGTNVVEWATNSQTRYETDMGNCCPYTPCYRPPVKKFGMEQPTS